ncbi:MAG: TonB-dependent receptor, partial [Gammaproteobacteria bacterium]|nr:TonB-dependent receptor [Gammaproteobacteria bacterium]
TGAGDPASYAAGPDTVDQAFGEIIPPGSQGDNGLSPADVVHLARHVSSAYVELEDDLTTRLLLDVAGRYSDYSDYGSSTTGKFSARYKLSDGLLVRGALSNSFRAPALAQTGIRFTTLNFNSTGTGLQNNAWLPPGDPLAELLGAQPLKPEKSVNATAGIALKPAARSYATLDFYQIRITDRITPTGQLSTAGEASYLAANGLSDIASVQYLTNALDTTTRGYDLVLGHDADLWGGNLRLTAAFNRNYLHEDREQNPALLSGTVLIPLEYGSPATKLVLAGDWSGSRWGAHLAATRYGTAYAFSFDSTLPTVNVPAGVGSNVQRYSPAWSIDVEGRVNLTRNVTLAIGGTDVFNRYPDQTTAGGSYGGSFPYNFAYPLGINGAYYYASLALTFAP